MDVLRHSNGSRPTLASPKRCIARHSSSTDRQDALKSILTEMAERGSYNCLGGISTKNLFYLLCWRHGGFCNRGNTCHLSWTLRQARVELSLFQTIIHTSLRVSIRRWDTVLMADDLGIHLTLLKKPLYKLASPSPPSFLKGKVCQWQLISFTPPFHYSTSKSFSRIVIPALGPGGMYHKLGQGEDDFPVPTYKVISRKFSRRFSDVPSTKSTFHKILQLIGSQNCHTSSSTLASSMRSIGKRKHEYFP